MTPARQAAAAARTASEPVRLTGIAGRLGCRSLLVATADGAEHEFRGKMGAWPSYLTGALTARGREVRTTPDGVVVMPGSAPGEG